MSNTGEPLDPDLAAMLEGAKPLESVPVDVSNRMLASLAARLAGSGGGGPGGTGSTGANAATLRAPWLSRSLVVGVGAFVLGAAVGASLRRAPPSAEHVVYVDRVVTATSSAASSVAEPVAPPAVPLAATSIATKAAPLPSSTGDALAAESALLDIARVAVAQGDGERALTAVSRHASQFPRGALAEEREALAVRALHLLGRQDEARAKANAFRQKYPRSIFLPAVQETTQSAP